MLLLWGCDVRSAQPLWLLDVFVRSTKIDLDPKNKGSLFPSMIFAFCVKILMLNQQFSFCVCVCVCVCVRVCELFGRKNASSVSRPLNSKFDTSKSVTAPVAHWMMMKVILSVVPLSRLALVVGVPQWFAYTDYYSPDGFKINAVRWMDDTVTSCCRLL